ncbi:hypothetical protein PGB90_002014 [Kerria lacca]
MQRVKGHGNQGGVRNGTENNEHENVNNWTHQNYNTANTSMAAASYSISNYYGASYPYPAYCMGDGANTWTNNEAIAYVGNYNGQMAQEAAAYGMEGMFGTPAFSGPFGQTNAPNATSFSYFPGSTTEYQAWGTGTSMPPVSGKPYENYYREGVYDSVDALKGIDQRLQNIEITAADNNSNKISNSKYTYGMNLNSVPVSSEKKTTWASIAKQPAKPIPQTSSSGSKKKGPGMPPPPMVPGRHNIDLNTWEMKNNNVPKVPVAQAPPPPPPSTANALAAKPVWNGPSIKSENHSSELSSHFDVSLVPPSTLPSSVSTQSVSQMSQKLFTNPVVAPTRPTPLPQLPTSNYPPVSHQMRSQNNNTTLSSSATTTTMTTTTTTSTTTELVASSSSFSSSSSSSTSSPPHSVVDKLKDKNNYNPSELELPPKGTRFFVIKSYSEDDVHRSIKYEIWCSTEHGNKRLDDAFNDQKTSDGSVYLFFSVNGSGHFCGVARMISPVDYGASSSVWAQDKWKGQFRVRWIYVKDVPNPQLRHIRLENNENKPVTNSRDTQEVPYEKGVSVLKIIHSYSHTTSIFDDFTHYEKRQEEGDSNKRGPVPVHQASSQHHNSSMMRNNPFGNRSFQNKDRDGSGNNYSQMNHNRRGGRNSGNTFNNQRNHPSSLRS